MKKSQRDRIKYIHDTLKKYERLKFSDVQAIFGVSRVTVASDIKLYQKLAPGNCFYSQQLRAYQKCNPFSDIEIPAADSAKRTVSVQVNAEDREILSMCDGYTHADVYSAGLKALGFKND